MASTKSKQLKITTAENIFLGNLLLKEIDRRCKEVAKETRSGPDPIITQNFVAKLKTSWTNDSTMTNNRFDGIATDTKLKNICNEYLKKESNSRLLNIFKTKKLQIVRPPPKLSGAQKRTKKKNDNDTQLTNQQNTAVLLDPYAEALADLTIVLSRAKAIASKPLFSSSDIQNIEPIFKKLDEFLSSSLNSVTTSRQDIYDKMVEVEKIMLDITSKAGITASWSNDWLKKKVSGSCAIKIKPALMNSNGITPSTRGGNLKGKRCRSPSTIKCGSRGCTQSIRKKLSSLSEQMINIRQLMDEKLKRSLEENKLTLKYEKNDVDIPTLDLQMNEVNLAIDDSVNVLIRLYEKKRRLEIAKSRDLDEEKLLPSIYLAMYMNPIGGFDIIKERYIEIESTLPMLFKSRYDHYGMPEEHFNDSSKVRKMILDKKHQIYENKKTNLIHDLTDGNDNDGDGNDNDEDGNDNDEDDNDEDENENDND